MKTNVVAGYLPPDLQGDAELLKAGKAALEAARQALQQQHPDAAYQQARSGAALFEEYRAQAIRAATADAGRRGASRASRVYLNIYFSLPLYSYATRGGRNLRQGDLRRQILEAQGEPVWPFLKRIEQ